MKKEAIRRGMSGFPLGVFIGYTITIILSLFWGEGYYWAVVPALVEQCGNEINAVILQFILSGVLGSVCAASSVIWENDNWSILKQTVIHFVIISFTMLPIAYFAHWMDHTFIAIVKYFCIFIAIYIAIWAVEYSVWKHKINQINDKIKKYK
ncbi:MAG TPA: DUF3021 domain-containing protein, partial [Clostridiaceae bacterium]|jgi:hypothetical protein|nr:DUF3021 domain-containing protein [Clostridiaceae bacterium]HBF77228.1 DUF3021 domain-containing protein [Clostridiaceae bacterium]HBG39762.1 DUF3021 domain-containing protein [Clostridiaceae bacterium]HBN27540.1 DUF3021 domain-containing protein [Clostridiaceae bacterium]HBX48375.1 DUF3021 domain-containing protein [Clostridiaceae bacterium]